MCEFVSDGKLVLLTPCSPTAGFSVAAAMRRNKLIYGLADFAVVVSSDHQTGGTQAAAAAALKVGWCPGFVRDGEGVPRGNPELLKLSAVSLFATDLAAVDNLPDRMGAHAKPKPVEPVFFGGR